eukprot:scaffold111013_cov41-Prasinocladus_malaysianus.AAC.2
MGMIDVDAPGGCFVNEFHFCITTIQLGMRCSLQSTYEYHLLLPKFNDEHGCYRMARACPSQLAHLHFSTTIKMKNAGNMTSKTCSQIKTDDVLVRSTRSIARVSIDMGKGHQPLSPTMPRWIWSLCNSLPYVSTQRL